MFVSSFSRQMGDESRKTSRGSSWAATPAAWIILTYSRALPSPMGGSLASNSTMALSTPRPAKAARTCSTVRILALPLESAVERVVVETFSMRASISGLPSRSTRRKRRPALGGRRQDGHVDPVAAMEADARRNSPSCAEFVDVTPRN